MKTFRLLAITIAFCAGTLQGAAQETIKQAFQRLISSEGVTSSHSISQERDVTKPDRPLKSLLNVYEFSFTTMSRLGQQTPELIQEVLNAFDEERSNPNCYYVKTHSAGKPDWYNIMYGDNPNSYYEIGRSPWSEYTIVSLIDPEDSTRSHRYCYVIEWRYMASTPPKKIKGTVRAVQGVLVETYARIPDLSQNTQPKLNDNLSSLQNQVKGVTVKVSSSYEGDSGGARKAYTGYNVKNAEEVEALFSKLADDYLNGELRNRLLNALTLESLSQTTSVSWCTENLQKNALEKIDELIKKSNESDPNYKECIAHLKTAYKNFKDTIKGASLDPFKMTDDEFLDTKIAKKEAKRELEKAWKELEEAEKDFNNAEKDLDNAVRDGSAKIKITKVKKRKSSTPSNK